MMESREACLGDSVRDSLKILLAEVEGRQEGRREVDGSFDLVVGLTKLPPICGGLGMFF